MVDGSEQIQFVERGRHKRIFDALGMVAGPITATTTTSPASPIACGADSAHRSRLRRIQQE